LKFKVEMIRKMEVFCEKHGEFVKTRWTNKTMNSQSEWEKIENGVNAESVPFSKAFASRVMNRTSKKVGNVQYSLERDIGIFDGYYSRFVSIGEGGTRVILYDTTVRGYFSGFFQYIILCIFPIGFVAIIVRKIKEEDKQM